MQAQAQRKDPRQAQLEQALEQYISLIDAEMAALSPSWEVPSLQESYAQASAQAAVGAVWDAALIDLAIAQRKALASQDYGDQKIQHLYL